MLRESTLDGSGFERNHPNEYEGLPKAEIGSDWTLEEMFGGDKKLDFSIPFLPKTLVQVDKLDFLDTREKLVLNQIKGHAYLATFAAVEYLIFAFLLDRSRTSVEKHERVRTLLRMAEEKIRHIQFFNLLCQKFRSGFESECEVVAPGAEMTAQVFQQAPLPMALTILQLEWMTERHYTDSTRESQELDPLFKCLLKHHAAEEVRHAKDNGQLVLALAVGMSKEKIEKGVDEYLEIVGFLDDVIRRQAILDLASLERATGRKLIHSERESFVKMQHQANRWTYIGSGMMHPKFLEVVEALDPDQRERIVRVSTVFC